MNWKYDCANFSFKDLAILRLILKRSIETKRQTDLTTAIQQGKATFKVMIAIYNMYSLIRKNTASLKTERIPSDARLKEKLKRKRNLFQKKEKMFEVLLPKRGFALNYSKKENGWLISKDEESFGILDLRYLNEWYTKSPMLQSPITKLACKREESSCETEGTHTRQLFYCRNTGARIWYTRVQSLAGDSIHKCPKVKAVK